MGGWEGSFFVPHINTILELVYYSTTLYSLFFLIVHLSTCPKTTMSIAIIVDAHWWTIRENRMYLTVTSNKFRFMYTIFKSKLRYAELRYADPR